MAHLAQQAHYLFRIEGHVDAEFLNWYGPVEVANTTENDGRVVTTLSGIISDQSGLVGLIRHLHGLGIVLLSFERLANAE